MKELMNVRMVENENGEIDLLIDPNEAANGASVDELMQALAAIRGQLQPPVRMELPATLSDLTIAPEPGFFLGDVFPQGLTLGLRHPAYGWLGFQLTPRLRAGLMQALESAPAPAPPTAGH